MVSSSTTSVKLHSIHTVSHWRRRKQDSSRSEHRLEQAITRIVVRRAIIHLVRQAALLKGTHQLAFPI